MTKSLYIFSLLVLCLVYQIKAQTQTPLITLTATGEVKVELDEAEVSFGIDTRNQDIDQVREENDAKASDAITVLKSLGVEEKDIQTSYTSLQPQYSYDPEKQAYFETPYLYIAQKSMTFVLRNLDEYDQIMAGLYKTGINQVSGISFRSSKIEEAQLEAKRRALKNAKKTATVLVKELGAKLGQVNSINVNSNGGPIYYNKGNVAFDSAAGGSSGPSVAAGEGSITADVTVSFMIKC